MHAHPFTPSCYYMSNFYHHCYSGYMIVEILEPILNSTGGETGNANDIDDNDDSDASAEEEATQTYLSSSSKESGEAGISEISPTKMIPYVHEYELQ